MLFSQLVYSPAKRGKSHYAATSYWDFANKKLLRNGRHIVIGLEQVKHLGLPEANIIRLVTDPLNPELLYARSIQLFKDVYKAAKRGEGPEVVVLDGISEYDLQVQRKLRGDSDEIGIKGFGTLLATFLDSMQYLHPEETKAPLIVTARVAERRKAIKDSRGNTWVAEDEHPEIAAFDYYPAVTGKFGHILPHYFDMVNYIENILTATVVGGRKVTKMLHRLYFQPTGDFFIANAFESTWDGKPAYLDNATFDQVLQLAGGETSK